MSHLKNNAGRKAKTTADILIIYILYHLLLIFRYLLRVKTFMKCFSKILRTEKKQY